ncbi:MAG: hypothetical protein HOP11_10235 [Saprospiraceae bacterium]|nr:hypothetical protein [Saprospiraceae bacterium]
MSSYLLKIVCFICIVVSIASKPLIKPELSYIDQFKEIAINEMRRTGIPASIKLAQGLTESMAGRSELAIQANNHFGIKCKSNWDGETYHYKDDDLDEAGQLIHSCFRKYTAAEESFIDHSIFLTGRSRYRALFSFHKSDYISWARGLQNCGYATDPLYANKLIETIEKYKLYVFDQEDNADNQERIEITNSKINVPERPAVIIVSQESSSKGLKSNSKKKSQLRRKLSKAKM